MKVVFTALFAIAIAFALAQPAVSTPATAYKEKVIYSFGPDAGSPVGVIKAKGASALYGAACCGANHGGMIYSLDLKTDAQTVLYSFCGQANCTDGAIANSPMREIGGLLYGTTQSGGAEGCGFMDAGCGVLFSLDPGTGTEKVLYTFCSQQNCADGAYPSPDLLMVNNLLYGTTVDGGDTSCGPGCGTVYSVDPTTGTEKALYSFCSRQQPCTDGVYPGGHLLHANGVLYGTTALGGVGSGTIFSLDMKTGAEKVLYSFCTRENCPDGSEPGGLIDAGGLWYGTTTYGGNAGCNGGTGCGTLFSFDPKTGAEKVIHAFTFASGWAPNSDLTSVNGLLYGTTSLGGHAGCYGLGCGVVYSIDPRTGTERVLHEFCSERHCRDGRDPDDLIAVNGRFYGTTLGGGANNTGAVFELKGP